MDSKKDPLQPEALAQVSGGVKQREKFVSAFYCEICKKTIHLNMIYSLERARKEHNAKFHPGIRQVVQD